MQFHSQGFHNMLSDSTRLPDDKSECEVMITAILRKERPLLDADISWIEKDVVAYEQELFDLEIQVTQLIRRRERLECSLSRRKSVLSPIHRPPRDIVVEIFRWVVHHPKNSLDVTKGVWPLGQVCGWWRDIVLTSPVLWSVVILDSPYRRNSVDILTHHFRRSAEFPLWIALTTRDSTVDGRVFDMVIEKSGLWKMMDICAYSKDLARLSSVSGKIPLLEELYVFAEDNVHFSTDTLFSPSLRRVDLEPLKISHLPLNASLLTHFTGTLYHLANIQYIAQIQTLIDIRILFCDDLDGPLDSGNLLPVEMEQLQFLSVTDVRILDALTTPSLRKFDYRPGSISNEGDTDIRPLRDFLARSACSIEHLCICVEMIQKIHHLMAFAKNVSYLTVYYSKGHPALDPLTLPETLPMMKSLRLVITDTGWRRRYPGGVIDVVRQRFNEERAAVLNVTKLSCLRIDCVDDSRAEFIDRLKGEGLDALEEEGLELEKGSPYLRVDEYWTGSWFT
ncbi:uncharacterized protein ARMOST_15075 [Armillaria ostoyae]|uniref:F-box domain-containing protein n=1 Tax=Armillaria ostoyae TaxID=47428 RepID=A0A284RSD7_ARMOS|nr:uncharacterized protein ARMOST_15075 [Armillaria ostoyae]